MRKNTGFAVYANIHITLLQIFFSRYINGVKVKASILSTRDMLVHNVC